MFDLLTTVNEKLNFLIEQLIWFLTEDGLGKVFFVFLLLIAYGYAFQFWRKLTFLESDAIEQATNYEKYINSNEERLFVLQTKLLATISVSLRLIAGLMLLGLGLWFFGVVQ